MTEKLNSMRSSLVLPSKSFFLALAAVVASWSISRLVANGEPLYYILPNLLIFTPFNNYSHKLYRDPADVLPEKTEHMKVKEIQAEDYSYEYMREVTEGFSKPVLVKGLFSNTTAGLFWDKPGYLKSKLGDMKVPVYKNLKTSGGFDKNSVELLSSGDVVEEIMVRKKSNHRFIFPQFALSETNQSDPVAMYAKAEEIMEDADLQRLRKGWGGKGHVNYIGQQLFIGCGLEDKNAYQGLDWHTEPGNNWFIQVTGMKRWFFVAPKDNTYMLPIKKTGRLLITADIPYITELHERLPVMYADVGPGDLIFNPEWYWHKTKVYPGPSISISMREFYLLRNLKSNPHYMLQLIMRLPFEMKSATFIGKFLKKLGNLS